MNWINYSKLKGSHALLSPSSSFRWLDYSEDKLEDTIYNSFATKRGTVLHELACDLIKNKIKITSTDKRLLKLELGKNDIPSSCMDIKGALETLVPYVADAIGFHMDPEIVLYYSDRCFGTTDAISFRNGTLRIHDLKTGTTPAHMEQLIFYAALFCLNYNEKPTSFETELRIYQGSEVLIHNPSGNDILEWMEKIKQADKTIANIYEREGIA